MKSKYSYIIESFGLLAVALVSAPLETFIPVQIDGYGFDAAFILVVVAIFLVVLLYVIFVKRYALNRPEYSGDSFV